MQAYDLRRIQLFRETGSHVLERIAALSARVQYEAGEQIFTEGDEGDRFYLIHDGEVRISKLVPGFGVEALTILQGGECFGEMALIDRTPRSADAVAESDVILYEIERKALMDLLDSDVALANELLWSLVHTMSARLREMNAKMTLLAAAGKFT